jgi:putative SOS response-associated peptidase YedK
MESPRPADMCGRMTQQVSPSEVARIFDAELREPDQRALDEFGPRYNVAPTDPLVVVTQRDDGRFVEAHRWGLVPAWAKSVAAVGSRMINARAETIARNPAFRASFLRRRCVIPADGFYEWHREGRQRTPFLIARHDGAPLAMAGAWSPWRDPSSGEWLLSCTVVTTRANGSVAQLHDRMPVLLDDDAWPIWLDPEVRDADLLADLLQPAPDDLLALRQVSRRLNNVANEGPELLVPEEPPGPPAPLTLFG